MKRSAVLLCILLVAPIIGGHAQAPGESPVRWTGKGPAGPLHPGETFEVKLEADISGDWHLYSATQPPGGPNPTRFSLASGAPFRLTGKIRQSPAPISQFDPNFGIETEFFAHAAGFHLGVAADAATAPGEYTIPVQVIFQVCDDKVCLPPTRVPVPIKLVVAAAGPPAQAAGGRTSTERQNSKPAPAAVEPTAAQVTESAPSPAGHAAGQAAPSRNESVATRAPAGTAAEVQQARSNGFLPFLWLSMTMGALSLATPCVFPMIPITVSYFTKSAESRRGSGIKQALVYCLGIVATFTGLGLGLAALLGATGINQFAANPWVNLLITAVFLGFALNLFGLYQIGVPSGVLTRLSKAGEGSGYAQALLMGLTFTLTSFTCTVPFVGTVLVATAQGDWLWPAMGMLGFSVVFAIPFFLLALVPRLLTSLPRSGGWLNSVKVTMGFLEVAAAMKFVSNVDLVWNWRIFTREVVLAVWIAVAVLATIYLLGKIRLPHDGPVESLGVMRMIFAMVFLALGFYLFTGLMGSSLGELDAFLPPRTSGGLTLTGSGSPGQELTWHTSLEPALAQARQEQKPVFVDFTGYTCTNCRWMEANIFPRPEIHAALQQFVRVQLYTDGAGAKYEDNQKYQKETFGTVALPLYVILDMNGKKLATFPGMTRKPDEFLAFLRTPGL